MQRDVEDSDQETSPKSRPGSRRNSGSHSRSSIKREKDGKKKSPLNSTVNSVNSTPKKMSKGQQNFDFVVTGKQILKRYDRANSLPAPAARRPSAESLVNRSKKKSDSQKFGNTPQSQKSHETSLEDDVTLDFSQFSDLEDASSKISLKQKLTAMATSTPKGLPQSAQRGRSASVQSHQVQKTDSRRARMSFDSKQSRDSTLSYSRDSLYKTSSSASPYSRQGVSTDLDCSSVSPEYSGQSSAEGDGSPRSQLSDLPTPRSQHLQFSSCCVSSWQDSEPSAKEQTDAVHENGEWNSFWANYNNSVAKVPMKSYYDQCPTPYRTENIDLADFEYSTEDSRRRSPDTLRNINSIIRNEGLKLTPRETQNIIKCAHILGNVLTRAMDRTTKQKQTGKQATDEINMEVEMKKKTMTLELKEMPLEVKEEKRSETVMTQTDISLPNTKSAPKIFENILRQLSRSSLEESLDPKNISIKEENNIIKEDEDPNNFKKG